jgi:hypothetical protein
MATPFTPGTVLPLPSLPYQIDPDDCIGDSVSILNNNTNYLATNTLNLSSQTQTNFNNVNNIIGSVVIFADVKANGTVGGTNVANTWNTRNITNIIFQSFASGASLLSSSNSFTLPIGKWLIEASAPAFRVNSHKIRIVDTVLNTIAIGTSENAGTGTYYAVQNRSTAYAIETISTGTKTYNIQHWTQTANPDDGLGEPTNAGVNEIYTLVKCTRIG